MTAGPENYCHAVGKLGLRVLSLAAFQRTCAAKHHQATIGGRGSMPTDLQANAQLLQGCHTCPIGPQAAAGKLNRLPSNVHLLDQSEEITMSKQPTARERVAPGTRRRTNSTTTKQKKSVPSPRASLPSAAPAQPPTSPQPEGGDFFPAPADNYQADNTMANAITMVCMDLRDFLLAKNDAYGNSAADPVRIFSKADPEEQLNVRIDDKISRLLRGGKFPGDDDELDLTGYLILKRAVRIHRSRDATPALSPAPPSGPSGQVNLTPTPPEPPPQ